MRLRLYRTGKILSSFPYIQAIILYDRCAHFGRSRTSPTKPLDSTKLRTATSSASPSSSPGVDLDVILSPSPQALEQTRPSASRIAPGSTTPLNSSFDMPD